MTDTNLHKLRKGSLTAIQPGAVLIKRRLKRNVGKDALGNITQNEWIVLENDIITGPNGDVSHIRLQAPSYATGSLPAGKEPGTQ